MATLATIAMANDDIHSLALNCQKQIIILTTKTLPAEMGLAIGCLGALNFSLCKTVWLNSSSIT